MRDNQTMADEVQMLTAGLPIYVTGVSTTPGDERTCFVIEATELTVRLRGQRALIYLGSAEDEDALGLAPVLTPSPSRWGFLRKVRSQDAAIAVRRIARAFSNAAYEHPGHFEALVAWLSPPPTYRRSQVYPSPGA